MSSSNFANVNSNGNANNNSASNSNGVVPISLVIKLVMMINKKSIKNDKAKGENDLP